MPATDAVALVAEIEIAAERAAWDVHAELAARVSAASRCSHGRAMPPRRWISPRVDAITAKHSLMHVAETALYRDALLAAAERTGLEVHRYEPGTVATNLAKATRLSTAEVDERLTEW